MGYTFNKGMIEPYLLSLDNIVIEVSKEFIVLTGFSIEELLGKSLIHIGDMLRISSQVSLESMDNNCSTVIFTKFLEVREVNISIFEGDELSEKIFSFIEKPNSRLEDKLIFIEHTFKDNIQSAAIYSVPDLILLKANERYLDFLDSPFNKEENSIGKPITEIVKGFIGIQVEMQFKNVIETQEADCRKELEFHELKRGVSYWDTANTPIFEKGKMKYIFRTSTEVTDRVLNREYESRQKEFEIQKALEEQNKTLNAIIENISDGLAVIDKQGNYVIKNKAVIDMMEKNTDLGTNRNKVGETIKLGQKYYNENGDVIDLKDSPTERALRGEEVKNQTLTVKHGDKEVHLNFNASPILDENGEFQFGVITCNDVTELIEKDKEIRRQKEYLEAIIKSMSDALIIYKKDRSALLLNEAARKVFYRADEYKRFGDGFETTKYHDTSGNDIDVENLPPIRSLRGEIVNNYVITFQHADKKLYYNVSSNPVYDVEGNIECAVVCLSDITEQFKRDEVIKTQKVLFEAVIENMHDALAIFNKEGDLRFINAEARKLYPHLNTQTTVSNYLNGFKCCDFENNPIPREKLPTRRVFTGEKIRGERIIIKRPERDQYTEINGTPIFDEEYNLSSVVIAHRDITELIHNQREIENKQDQLLITEKAKNETLKTAMELKDEFLYLITHEFKTPMAVINLALQAIDSICKDDVTERLGRYINTIKLNTNRQLRLVNNLLDVTKINSGNIKINRSNFDVVYIAKSIVSSVEIYAKQKKVNLKFTSSITKKEVYLDEEKFERIMLNLLSNALKFTPRGKSINIVLSTKKYKNKNFISVSVKDEGIGIPVDKQKIIFERFGQADTTMSRQAEGTGIGLHLVTLLVNALDGAISVESEVGKGSTFTVLLPAIKPISHEEVAACSEHNNQFISGDNKILQSVSIEFSDIYFD
jgi:signal transduction histidine kinase